MLSSDINVGDVLRLKRGNPYGLPPLEMQVMAITYRDCYKVPWIRASSLDLMEHGAFKPSDFDRRRSPRRDD